MSVIVSHGLEYSGRRRKMRGRDFKFKVGANREVEKLTTGMANYPASFLGC